MLIPRPDTETLVERAREEMNRRRGRTSRFNPAMFGEPAWDILLALYTSEDKSQATSIEQLSSGAGTSPEATARWLSFLEGEGLISVRNQWSVASRQVAELTARAREDLDSHFCE